MNKVTKGALATGAGVLLLLGGGGTLALWNTDEAITAGTVTAGQLDLTPDGAGAWTVTNAAAGVTDQGIAIGSYKVVPGDVLTFTQTVDVTLEGNNMEATLAIAPGTVANTFGSAVVVSPVTMKDSAGDALPATLNGSEADVKASATFRFSDAVLDGTAGNDGSGDTYGFGDVKFVLTQVPYTP
ncbi:alternate signal-mediated exported protein [Arthrobacter pascens]|uniref:alternate-type signal peptide domain-containing protein n=1 Tax=Arthrobacter pascens TaxID=1677 RepID=UPI002861622A|nr:alternate-type signal peptide domain-containing protein [Arthrobacter pascens]MDR6555996.1 alternate signal-mediated exported protein [Arthrobacter pascens]